MAGRTFVLVHGAWHGAWCWRRVSDLLTANGHRVFAPTLTGLADRSHLMPGAINLDTHVSDVVNLFRWEDIEDAVLVGHSYAGWVISGAIEQLEGRVSAIVYLDAFVPQNGQRGYDLTSAGMRAAIDAAKDRGEVSRPAPPAASFGVLSAADIAWVDAKMTPQPLGVSLQPITLTGARERVARKLYIRTPAFAQPGFDAAHAACRADPSWRTLVMPVTGHDVMVDQPQELAEILEGA
jgi:pimeloyl-ACP methyl ester carboxylesterase